MAKGQVSEEELTKGLKNIGNFGGISGRVQRDNPFRDSREVIIEQPKPIEVRSPEPRIEKTKGVQAAQPAAKPLRRLPPQKVPSRGRVDDPRAEEGSRKADIFTERVTLQISPEMRDEIDALARDLQGAKTSKKERITSNTVMRVALQLLMNNYQFQRGDVANTEIELYDLVLERFQKK